MSCSWRWEMSNYLNHTRSIINIFLNIISPMRMETVATLSYKKCQNIELSFKMKGREAVLRLLIYKL